MLRSSLGFHTISLSLRLSSSDMQRLIEDFYRYKECTGAIRMRMLQIIPSNQKLLRVWNEYTPKYSDTSLLVPKTIKISYSDKNNDRGIKWTLRVCTMMNSKGGFDSSKTGYFVEVTINPKVLLGIRDYITSATCDDLEVSIFNFNHISREISPLLCTFDDYTLKRVDYCVNFAINELYSNCTAEQIMELIRRGNIPRFYEERKEYDEIGHRKKANPDCFYLESNSVTINCYRKVKELQQRRDKGMTSITKEIIDGAQDIIRFEVQCEYQKIYSLLKKAGVDENSSINKYRCLLTHEFCEDIITDYIRKTIGVGHWHSLEFAISSIKSRGFNSQKENRLIEALRLVNECRGVEKAKALYQGDDLAAFKRTLNELNTLCINPVTIPKAWGIGFIWCLMDVYDSAIYKDRRDTEFREEILRGLKKHSKKYIKYLV